MIFHFLKCFLYVLVISFIFIMILFTFFGNGTKTPCSVEGDLVVAAVVVAAFVVVAFVVALVVVVVTL